MKVRIFDVVPKIILMLLFSTMSIHFLLKGKELIDKDGNFILLIIGLIILAFTLIIISKWSREPFFINVDNVVVSIRSIPFVFKKKIPNDMIVGFSLSKVEYGLFGQHSYEILILYLKNSRKLHLVGYHFKDIHALKGKLQSKKIKFLGRESAEYKFGLKRKYKYDR